MLQLNIGDALLAVGMWPVCGLRRRVAVEGQPPLVLKCPSAPRPARCPFLIGRRRIAVDDQPKNIEEIVENQIRRHIEGGIRCTARLPACLGTGLPACWPAVPATTCAPQFAHVPPVSVPAGDNVVILCVLHGTSDPSTASAIKLAQEYDEDGDQTMVGATWQRSAQQAYLCCCAVLCRRSLGSMRMRRQRLLPSLLQHRVWSPSRTAARRRRWRT